MRAHFEVDLSRLGVDRQTAQGRARYVRQHRYSRAQRRRPQTRYVSPSMTLEDWDAGYRDVLRNMLELTSSVLPGMAANGWGRIVALTSSSVKQPIPNLTLSNAFRTALVAALKTLSIEVASDGITVNSIATGRVDTDRLHQLYPDEAAMHAAAKADMPIGRVATPAEFAPMVAFLCSEPARYVTGQTIAIDGGMIKSLF